MGWYIRKGLRVRSFRWRAFEGAERGQHSSVGGARSNYEEGTQRIGLTFEMII
jgi:hypothetical protein